MTFDEDLRMLVAFAWDTGAITTGEVTVPVIVGLGAGVAKPDTYADLLTYFYFILFTSVICLFNFPAYSFIGHFPGLAWSRWALSSQSRLCSSWCASCVPPWRRIRFTSSNMPTTHRGTNRLARMSWLRLPKLRFRSSSRSLLLSNSISKQIFRWYWNFNVVVVICLFVCFFVCLN
jgi:hypothetical protein